MSTLESDRQAAADPERSGERVPGGGRALLLAAAAPLVTGYVGVAAVFALVTATAPGATLSTGGVLRAAASGWLAGYHVPITIHGHELGLLPLLPTALVLALVARTAANTAYRMEWDTPRSAAKLIGAIATAHGVFAAVLAATATTASPVVAFFVAGILAAVAATAGTARPCGLADAVLARADDTTVAGLRAGRLAVLGLFAVGVIVFAACLIMSWSTAVHMFQATAPGAGSGLGMFLLSVAYLPNVLIGTLSFVAGPGFAIGRAVVAPLRVHAGPIPGVPVLAPVPVAEAHWWIALLALPVAAGVLAGLRCRDLRSVGVAALMAGVTWLVLAALAGGALAGGPFDPVTVPAGLLAVAVFGFVAIPGALTASLAGREKAPEEPTQEEPAEEVTTATIQAGHGPEEGTA